MQSMILIEFCGNALSITPYIGFFQDDFQFSKKCQDRGYALTTGAYLC